MTPQQKWNNKNKDKLLKATVKYRELYPERIAKQNQERARYKRNLTLRTVYGVTLLEWEEMFRKQNFKCAICKCDKPKAKGWNTDHCHKTGKVRGILCSLCNWMLGNAMDDIEVLNNAIEYLKTSTRSPIVQHIDTLPLVYGEYSLVSHVPVV